MASVIRGSDNFDSVYAKPKAQCTAWVNFNGTTTPPTIRDSYNVSSVVRTATSTYDVYFEKPMDNINYSMSGFGSDGYNSFIQDESFNYTNKVQLFIPNPVAANVNHSQVTLNVFGGKN